MYAGMCKYEYTHMHIPLQWTSLMTAQYEQKHVGNTVI